MFSIGIEIDAHEAVTGGMANPMIRILVGPAFGLFWGNNGSIIFLPSID
jgi:hypothetical protein